MSSQSDLWIASLKTYITSLEEEILSLKAEVRRLEDLLAQPPTPITPPLYTGTISPGVNVNVRDDAGNLVRNAAGNIVTLAAGTPVSVYELRDNIGGWQDRAVIDPPGIIPRRNVYEPRVIRAVGGPPPTGGGWLWPVRDMPHTVNSGFDVPRSYGKHEGVDLKADNGSVIQAVTDGIVTGVHPWAGTRSGWDAYGNYVTILHGEYTALYAHMQSYAVGVNQSVTRGQEIGRANNTGNTTGPHLHFHVTHPSAPPVYVFGQRCIDPLPLISGEGTDFLEGFDVSHHNGAVNFIRAYSEGKRFVWIKASESDNFIDPNLQSNRDRARDAGLLYGFYHFFRPQVDSVAQIKYFRGVLRNLIQDDRGSLPPALDVEVDSGFSPEVLTEKVILGLQTLRVEFGRRPILYTGFSFSNDRLLPVFGEYPLWLGRYTSAADPGVPNGWKAWTIWQYKNNGTIGGAGPYDFNRFRGTLEELRMV